MRELAKAKQEMAVLRLEHQRLSAKLQEYSIFNKYLEKVVENSEVCGGLGGGLLQPYRLVPRGLGCGPSALGRGLQTRKAAGRGPW
jgi:hypothetical protein